MPSPSQKAKGSWVPLRTASGGNGEPEAQAPPLPGKRGRYLLYLGAPIIEPIECKGRYVHVSWSGESYCLRDYIAGLELRDGDFAIEDIWRRAVDRIPATGDLYVPHTEGRFWKEKLETLTAVFQSKTGHKTQE